MCLATAETRSPLFSNICSPAMLTGTVAIVPVTGNSFFAQEQTSREKCGRQGGDILTVI